MSKTSKWFAAAGLCALAACAARKPVEEKRPRDGLEKRSQVLHLDPIRIIAEPGGKTRVEEVDVAKEFQRAAKLYEGKRYDEALKAYTAIAEDVGGTANEVNAVYNAGLCLELLGRYDEALAKYAFVVSKAPKSAEARDADVRRVLSLRAARRWREMADVAAGVLLRKDFDPIERTEIRIWRGMAQFRAGEIDDARTTLRAALEKLFEMSRFERLDKALAAQLYFWLGEISRKRFLAVSLDDPKIDLTARMQEKARYMYEAREEYLRAAERGEVYWSAAAGHRIARVYEKFREHVLAIPIPRELNEAQAEVYAAELARHKLIEPFLAKATHAHEQVLKLAERTGHDSEWVARSRAAIERLKRLVLKTPVAPPVTTP